MIIWGSDLTEDATSLTITLCGFFPCNQSIMARLLRIEFPGAVYHITAHGNAQQSVFLELLGRVHDRHSIRPPFAVNEY